MEIPGAEMFWKSTVSISNDKKKRPRHVIIATGQSEKAASLEVLRLGTISLSSCQRSLDKLPHRGKRELITGVRP